MNWRERITVDPLVCHGKACIRGTRKRSYLRETFLEDIVNGHIKGNRNCTSEIHRALTAELIQRQLVEQW